MLVSERITGKGAVQSLDLAVGVPLWEIEPFLAVIVVGLVYVGLRFPKEAKKLAEVWVQLTCLKQADLLHGSGCFFPGPHWQQPWHEPQKIEPRKSPYIATLNRCRVAPRGSECTTRIGGASCSALRA